MLTLATILVTLLLQGEKSRYSLRKWTIISHVAAKGSNAIKSQEIQEDIKTFRNLKFGLFIHWGLYSALAGEWHGQQIPARRPYAEQIDLTLKIPNAEYEETAATFNPVSFDAHKWVAIARRAGVKYLVVTAKHQDGFSMFRTSVSDYNFVDKTPFHRDPIKELAEACHSKGIAFRIYYSDARDYHEAGANWNNYGNTWDFSPQSEADFKKYVYGKVFSRVRELLTNYGKILLMWFDVPYKMKPKMSADLRDLVKSIQPHCLINSRIGNGLGDYISGGDNAVPAEPLDTPEETCMTMNHTWGYSRFDHDFKSARIVLQTLADIVSKGGNLLLNVGPDGLGTFPPESRRMLDSMGTWLQANGAALYNTRPQMLGYVHPGWYSTKKPGKFFFLIADWPRKTLMIKGIKESFISATFLANGEPVRWVQSNETVKFLLPAAPPDPNITVIEVKVKPPLETDTP